MACLKRLREDIAHLETIFPKNHPRVQTVIASVDEITLRFVSDDGTKVVCSANIQENYPRQSPIWFSESENPVVTAVLERLTETIDPTPILAQIHQLVHEMCSFFNVTAPVELGSIAPPDLMETDEGQGSELNSDDEEEEGGEEEDMDEVVEMGDDDASPSGTQDEEGLSPEGKAMLDNLHRQTRQQHLDGKVKGSVTATDRLMKELKEVYRSEHFKDKTFSIELEKDSLYEWWVKLHKVDPDSPLHSDMQTLLNEQKQDHLLFHFVFNDSYPFDPPFVRLVSPPVSNGFVLGGGAICMELLTKQGWTSAYSIESLIMQIAATLVKGKARVQFDSHKGVYSLAKAQQSFKSLVQIHAKSGWYTPPQADG
ncbi:hypothetical protein PENTCL1PPCAC_22367 [Pristionchus entomophagus]|uniref:UBC core domain-containing protein n=1 Tax=Pristionchus entomophagus TaxID=358040 RepID=A0AAV5U146_9BILA|nr:hypothetical protein PENTCL1PPCAC_22365 [Pristionchus entomophagus]GMT00193.1 hypothetical protein PENTCL1PPCAC_22367 [Pristionchus entomophagus]